MPFLLIGDLNVTPWSCSYARLVRTAGLESAFRGRGLHPTWPVGLWPLHISIDHGLYQRGIRAGNVFVGRDVGSDDFPVMLEVGLAPRSPGAP